MGRRPVAWRANCNTSAYITDYEGCQYLKTDSACRARPVDLLTCHALASAAVTKPVYHG